MGLPLWPVPLPAPAPAEGGPCLGSSDRARRCTSTAAGCAPPPRTAGIKYVQYVIMLCTHVHEADLLRMISDQPVPLRACLNCYLGISCYDNNEHSKKKEERGLYKKSVHTLFLPCFYFSLSNLMINRTDKQHEGMNKQQAFNRELSEIMIPWCLVIRCRLHLLNYVWHVKC